MIMVAYGTKQHMPWCTMGVLGKYPKWQTGSYAAAKFMTQSKGRTDG